ncbi:MAG: cupredoxin domain-containing protein [Myxococcota bacterium]|nr:cupredoxin domain-containing protein [Deltaproteobacteria bacterium]MDQ3340962.1 cupredoxin domain-containing protein [Myxococcota bacterium]
MMMRVALGLALALTFGCKKAEKSEDKPTPAATVKTGTRATDGVRTIEIAANEKGYVPDRIPGKPGEKLKLKFTRTIDGECLSQLKTPDGKLVELPKNAPIEVDVTVPADGEVKFACGMDMFFAVVVAEKA